MSYSLYGITKLLQDLETRQKKAETKRHNKKIGYAPKCKVCNDPKLDEIEKLRKQGYTYEDIVEELELDYSIMSLSRHFKNHYPKSQEYKRKQQIQMLKNIKEAYLQYPFLEEYFKNKPLEYLEDFNTNSGFCTDRFSLCNYIPASTVSDGHNTIFCILENEIEEIQEIKNNSWSMYVDEKVNELKFKNRAKANFCLNCKNHIQEERLTLLEKIITYNFLNIAPENKELYFNLLQFDGNPDEFIQKLTEVKEGNTAK